MGTDTFGRNFGDTSCGDRGANIALDASGGGGPIVARYVE